MKRILLSISAILGLVLTALLVVPSFIDWTDYRVEIAQKVKEASGRDLLIGGEIELSLLPSPVLRVSDIHLSNGEGASNADMVAIRQLDVRVALFPLFGGNLHIESIRLIEPVIHLEMMADGQASWKIKANTGASENIETTPQVGSPVFDDEIADDDIEKDNALLLQIDSFIIEKGLIVYSDVAAGIEERVENFNSRFSIAGLTGPFEAAGTASLQGVPMGFDASIGRIIHGRTASFASQIKLAHGQSTGRVSGTFVNLTEGPKVQGKVEIKGESLAGLFSAFQTSKSISGGLNRPFNLDGEVIYSASGLSLGKEGLSVTLGSDHGKILVDFDGTTQRNLKASVEFSKIDGDAWLNAEPYKPRVPKPLPLVITPSKPIKSASGEKVSAALSQPVKKAKKANEGLTKTFSLPKEIEGQVSVSVDALMLKGKAVRQFETSVSMGNGELALERLSAVLPGAGEVSLIGAAGPREGKLQFDGSLDLSVAHLRGALDWLEVDYAGVASDRLQQVILRADISANQDEVRLLGLNASMDGSSLKGAATIALRSRPSFGVNLELDRLNLDAYKVKKTAVGNVKKSGEAPRVENDEAVSTKNTTKNISAQEISLNALQALDRFDANISVSIGHVIYEKRDVRSILLDATIYDGDVVIKKASINNFAGITMTSSGGIKRKDNVVSAENINVTLQGDNWNRAANLVDAGAALDWKKTGPLSVSATLNGDILAPDVDINVDIFGGAVIVAGSADLFPLPKGDATVNLQFPNMDKAVRALKPSYRPAGKMGAMELNADVSFNLGNVSVKNMKANIGQSDLSGQILFTQGKRASIDVDLASKNLQLDPFMPKESKAKATKKTKTSSATPTSKQGGTQGKNGHWSHEKIDLSALNSLDAKIRFKADKLSYKQTVSKNIIVQTDLKDGVLNIKDTSLNVFGGKAELVSKVDVRDGAKINIDFKAAGLNMGEILIGTGQKGSIGGRVDVNSHLETQGLSEADLVSKLDGLMDVNMKQISVGEKGKGGSALDILNLLAVLSGTDPKKGLADVTLKSEIKQGVAVLKTASLSSNIATGSAQGHVDLPQWIVDISGKLDVKQNALVGLLARKAKMKSSYPFSVRGNIDQPNVKLDTGSLSSGGGLIIPLSDKLDKKGYGNIIRGLLGAGGVKTSPAPKNAVETNPSPSVDGTMQAPPPPASPGKTSKEQLLIEGLGALFKR